MLYIPEGAHSQCLPNMGVQKANCLALEGDHSVMLFLLQNSSWDQAAARL